MKCGTMQRLYTQFEQNAAFKKKFEATRAAFNQALEAGDFKLQQQNSRGGTIYTIPVVFHVVLKKPNTVTDEEIQAQLDTLNKDFAGVNGDSTKVPAFFKPLFGKSSIRFCLAQRTPDGDYTSGIERVTTTKNSFSTTDDAVKHAATGGANGWNANKYFNVWVCALSNNVLGYATFPEDSTTDVAGVVIDYTSLPGGAAISYNGGKTLTHETGHYFNLYHIWGDDDGACTGTDYIDDTPNQADHTSGCYNGVHTDSCTSGGHGIMYENYMDYSDDDCLVMFTTEQVDRMEAALLAYRSSLLTSDGCTPPVLYANDAALKTIDAPGQRICTNTIAPVVTIRNAGTAALTSLTIHVAIDGNSSAAYNWTGSLTHSATAQVTLNNLSITEGKHVLTIYTTAPNGKQDAFGANDTLFTNLQYYGPVTNVSEGFEGNTFVPVAWDIVNPDHAITWQQVNGIAHTGNGSVTINNFNYTVYDQQDYLRMPQVNIGNVDSAFLSFYVAAATYTPIGVPNNTWDTLEVLVSTDCGNTYTSLYKKYGSDLVTRKVATTISFTPTADEWRKDSINLGDYINSNNLLFAFRNITENENNIYLDDVNLRTVTINPNLKSKGFLVSPSPTTGKIAVQFYPQPANLRSIEVYSITGQKLAQVLVNANASNYYQFDLSRYASGVYVVRAFFTDKVLTKKIIKQ